MQSESSATHKDSTEDTTVLDFSVLPAPTDAPASFPSEMLQDGSKKLNDTIVEANKFGASSEKSMVYARTAGDLTGDRVQASGTKIDVPGARLVVEIPSEEPLFKM